ncbi:recombinase family protein [Citrobacter freundii]|uniref:recombinase family protein n=1 Tax=Citrobacter freundii TaxID=546 RepID=UPI000A3B307D|nr:recombinase family protein [Citrobacter freundii]OUE69898.1 hypothetical protein AZ007_002985 [Citrobacter freundii]
MATYGYVRVSTQDQNIARQMSALDGVVEPDNILIEKISGKDTNRPQLQRLLNDKLTLRPGDTLVIKSIDRLARNTKDLLEIVDILINKGVTVRFIDNTMTFDNTPASRLILTMMGAVAEFERGVIRQRQAEGIEIAKGAGKFRGRQAKQSLHDKVRTLIATGEHTNEKIADLAECGVATVYRIKKSMTD